MSKYVVDGEKYICRMDNKMFAVCTRMIPNEYCGTERATECPYYKQYAAELESRGFTPLTEAQERVGELEGKLTVEQKLHSKTMIEYGHLRLRCKAMGIDPDEAIAAKEGERQNV